MELELEFVTLGRCILVTGDDIESGILDVSNGLWLCTIRIYLHPLGDSILLEILDDVLVLHVCPVASLPHPQDFLSVVCHHLHPGGWIIGESKVHSLDLNQVIHLRFLRE